MAKYTKEYIATNGVEIQVGGDPYPENGFHGTQNELLRTLRNCDADNYLSMCGFEFYDNDFSDFEFIELRKNYWILRDKIEIRILCKVLNAKTLNDAIKEVSKPKFSISLKNAEQMEVKIKESIVWRDGNISIIEDESVDFDSIDDDEFDELMDCEDFTEPTMFKLGEIDLDYSEL